MKNIAPKILALFLLIGFSSSHAVVTLNIDWDGSVGNATLAAPAAGAVWQLVWSADSAIAANTTSLSAPAGEAILDSGTTDGASGRLIPSGGSGVTSIQNNSVLSDADFVGGSYGFVYIRIFQDGSR